MASGGDIGSSVKRRLAHEQAEAAAAAEAAAVEAATREAAAQEAAIAAAATAAATSTATAAASPAAPTSRPKPPPPKAHRLGAELREQLEQIGRLKRSHAAGSNQEAASLQASVQGAFGPMTKEEERRAEWRDQKAAQKLRDNLFTIGDYQATSRVLQRFMQMPEVRQLLSPEYKLARGDAQFQREVLDKAKAFFGELLPAGGLQGRRNAEDQNAALAAAVALTPHDVVKNRKLASLMRSTGVSYRLAKAASAERGAMEDRAGGWRRVEAKHSDRAHYGPMAEAWHEVLSEPDNANKQLVRVFLGVDQKTGQKLYDFHARRAPLYTSRKAIEVFRASSFGDEFRKSTITGKRTTGCVGGRRQLMEAKCACIMDRKPSECACERCTFVSRNLGRLHAARPQWHRGKVCDCRLHSTATEETRPCDRREHAQAGWHQV